MTECKLKYDRGCGKQQNKEHVVTRNTLYSIVEEQLKHSKHINPFDTTKQNTHAGQNSNSKTARDVQHMKT